MSRRETVQEEMWRTQLHDSTGRCVSEDYGVEAEVRKSFGAMLARVRPRGWKATLQRRDAGAHRFADVKRVTWGET